MCANSNIAAVETPSNVIAAGSNAGATRNVAAVGALLFASMIPVTLLVAPLKELVGHRFGAGPFWTHTFMSINMIGAVIATPIIGMLSDAGGKRVRIAALALAGDACLLAGMSLVTNLGSLLALRFFEGAAHILAISTLMAIAAGWAGETKRGRTMGIVGSAMMLGTACGTRLGGEVWRLAPDWTFLIAGMVSAAAALGVAMSVREACGGKHDRGGWRPIFSLVRERRELIVPYLYAFVDRLCVGVLISTFVLFMAEVHGLTPSDRSRMLAYFLVPFALLVYPVGRLVDRVGRVWPLTLGTGMFGVVFASYGLIAGEQLVPLMVLSGVISAVMFAPNLTLCADLAPAAQRGAAFTGLNAAGSLGMLLGPLVGGALYSLTIQSRASAEAYQLTFIVTGGLVVLCTVATLPMLLRLRKQGATR